MQLRDHLLFALLPALFAAETCAFDRASLPGLLASPPLAQGGGGTPPPWTGVELPPAPQPRAHKGQKADHP